MSGIADRLRERRQNVWEQAKELADRAADENRAFDATEQGTWDSLNEELDKLDERIKAVLEGEERAKKADEAFERLGRSGGGEVQRGGQQQQNADNDLDAKFRALARGEVRSVEVGLPTAAERRAFREEQRVTQLKSNVPMPTTFIGQLYQFLIDTSSIRQANPRVYTTQTGENLTIPRSTAEGSAAWVAEAAQLAEAYPTISSVTLGAWKVGKVLFLSRELVDDAGFDLLGYLAEEAGRQVGLTVDAAYVNGDGSSKPSGIIGSATTVAVPAGGVTTFPSASLFDLYHSIIPQYRARASWLMHDSMVKVIRQLRDDSGAAAGTGNYLWQPGLQAGQPDTLLGRPVYADPNVPVRAANSKSILFGDFGGYWIRDVSPLRFDRSDEFKFDSDVVSFRVLYRTDGKQGDTNAVKVLQFAAT